MSKLVVALIAIALSMLHVARVAADDASAAPLRFPSARFLMDDSPAPPADDDTRWESVHLPDRWDARRPGQGGFGWYRFEVPGPREASERLALSLAGVNMNAEAFVNGVPFGSGGRMTEPVARNANRPLYFALPGSLLDRQRNHVDVRLFAYANDVGALASVSFGPDPALRDEYRGRHFLQIELTQITSALIGLLAVFFGGLWLGAGRDPVHGWFAIAAGAWTFVSLNYWVQNPGVSHWTWVRLFYLALGTFTVAIPMATHRLLGIRRPRAERVLLGLLVVYAALAALLPNEVYPRIVTPFQALWLASGTYGVCVLAHGWRAFSRWEAIVYLTGGVVCTGLAVAEQLDAWGLGEGWRPHLMPYIGSILVLCLATPLSVRFAVSLQEARRTNRDLEERVRGKTRELEANHARLRVLERQQVLSDERGRIVREMHDGIGAQLVATLAMVQSKKVEPREVANALRDALDDMRAVIDSMDPLIDDLGKLLGSLRSRFAALQKRDDLRFVWNVGPLPATPWLGSEQHLHIMRILQEAIANAIKHAQPSELEVSVECVDSPERGLRIAVRDDGENAGAPTVAGRGIGHMQKRARMLRGRLRILKLDPGTCVELWLPIPADDTRSSEV